MDSVALEVESLHKVYRDGWLRRRSVTALEDVSFSVARGTIFGLLGPNGAGKTTLIKILLGLVHRTSGRASLLGSPAGDRLGRRHVGYLPESHRIPRHLTGSSSLRYYGGLSGMSPREVKGREAELLGRVGLKDRARMSVKGYSKGMLQRLGLAQAILHDPQLLILDEPTDGVDPVGRSEMRTLLQELKSEGKTIFINSHLLQEVELICDRVAILVHGTLRRVGSVEELTRRENSQVEFMLAGDESAIRSALDHSNLVAWRPEGDGRFQVTVQAADQETVNRCIDQLRRNGIEIVSLVRPRGSLEEAFLGIVAGSGPSAPETLEPAP